MPPALLSATMPPGAAATALPSMAELDEHLASANAQRACAFKFKEKTVQDGLANPAHFILPKWMPPPSEEAVFAQANANGSRRGLVADPGGRGFRVDGYLRGRLLNQWVRDRCVMPLRSYERFAGDERVTTGLYRSHSQPMALDSSATDWYEEALILKKAQRLVRSRLPPSAVRSSAQVGAPPADRKHKMGGQHERWLAGHRDERERHLFPLYAAHEDEEAYQRLVRRRRNACLENGLRPPHEPGIAERQAAKLEKKPVQVVPHVRDWAGVSRDGRQFGQRYPWELSVDEEQLRKRRLERSLREKHAKTAG